MAYRDPKDLADRLSARRRQSRADDGYVRETFTQSREQARATARAFLDRWPAAYFQQMHERIFCLPGYTIAYINRDHDPDRAHPKADFRHFAGLLRANCWDDPAVSLALGKGRT